MRRVLTRFTYRMGVQAVEYDREADQCWLTLQNRTYRSEQPVSSETARRYYEKMLADGSLPYRPGPHGQ